MSTKASVKLTEQQETTDNPEHVRLDIQDWDIGTIHVRIEAGKQLRRRCRAYTELHSADVGVADEAKSKRYKYLISSTRGDTDEQNQQCSQVSRSALEPEVILITKAEYCHKRSQERQALWVAQSTRWEIHT
jgi:hypothetical protein